MLLSYPGGYVLENKDLYESVVFHVKEQIGLGVEKKDIKIVHIMHYPLGKKLYILLKTKKFNGKSENKIPMEYSEISEKKFLVQLFLIWWKEDNLILDAVHSNLEWEIIKMMIPNAKLVEFVVFWRIYQSFK